MNEKIVLTHPSLHFISTGRAKMHATETPVRPMSGLVASDQQGHFSIWIDTETWVHTLCGQAIPRGTEPQVSRKLDPAQLCKRCYTSLQPYWRVGKVKLESGARV